MAARTEMVYARSVQMVVFFEAIVAFPTNSKMSESEGTEDT